jgi:hypothetical protein
MGAPVARTDPRPTLPVLRHVRAVLDELFSLPPAVIGPMEVAAITYGGTLLQLNLTQAQIATYAAAGLGIYLGAKAIVQGAEQIAGVVAKLRGQE